MAKRRTAYGEGGIYDDPQRPGRKIIKVPDGHGGYIRRRAVDAAAAQAKYDEIRAQLARGQNPRGAARTLQQLVLEWREKVLEPRQASTNPLSPATVHDYRTTITRYLLPSWGRHRMAEFDVQLVLDIFHALRREYSDYTAHNAITKLHMLLEVACRWDWLVKNPVEGARPDIPPYKTEEKQALTPEETTRLLKVVDGHRLELLYHVALTLGLRPGELLALQWGDIDWKAKTLTVRRQVQELSGKISIRNQTKYGDGKRVLPLPPILLSRLKTITPASLWLFPNEDGTGHIRPRNFNRHFAGGRETKTKAGVKTKVEIRGIRHYAKLDQVITPHCFRHTVETRMLELGIADPVRDAIMGHGKKGHIRERYTHVRVDVMRQAVEAVERALWAPPVNNEDDEAVDERMAE